MPTRFDRRPFGGDYDEQDEPKFRSDLERVRQFFERHSWTWVTKEEIRIGCGLPVGKDVTPRIRDLRKAPFSFVIECKRLEGLNFYKYTPGSQ